MKDLKGEVKELFSGDQQLVAELEFNLQEKENLENQTSRMVSVVVCVCVCVCVCVLNVILFPTV